MQLPEGFHALRVPIPNNPLGFLLSYIVVGANGHTLIDTGWNVPEAFQSLVSQLDDLGLKLVDVRQVILTHMHPDHSGLADQIRRESGAKVFSHKLEVDSWRAEPSIPRFDAYGVPPDVYENSWLNRRHSHRPSWPEPDELLSGGEIIEAGDTKLEVIWTPGHAQGHICLYERKNRLLFAGDHVLPITTPNVSLLWTSDDQANPLGDYLASLEKLKELEVDVVLPAHDHIFLDLAARLEEMEHHHEARLQEMLESASGKWATPFEVAKTVAWTIGPFDSLEGSHKVMAVGETLAHLEFLCRRGELTKRSENGVFQYNANGR